jgi:hypothetical protein
MQLLLIPYLFVVIQAISVFIYIEILNKKLKVSCDYGWSAGWIIPFFLTLIIVSSGNGKTPTTGLHIILNIILFFGLCPLLFTSFITGLSASQGGLSEGGGFRDGCENNKNIL